MDWIKLEDLYPPEDVVLETKIDDGQKIRNECDLILHEGLFFFADMSMYIYYTPTHWREK